MTGVAVPSPTNLRAVLIAAADIVETRGLSKGKPLDEETGGVCCVRALTIATDGDHGLVVFAVFEVERLLAATGGISDLVAWQDRPAVTPGDAARLMRNTARFLGHEFLSDVA